MLQIIVLVVILSGTCYSHGIVPQGIPVPLTSEEISTSARLLSSIPDQRTWYSDLRNVSSKISPCEAALGIYAYNIQNFAPWAVKMFDASSKIPDGVMSLTFTHLGNFDQCLSVKTPSSIPLSFTGQHCEVNYAIDILNLNLAACIPSVCTAQEMEIVLQNTFATSVTAIFGIPVTVNINQNNCYNGNDKPALDAAAWTFISILIVIGVLLVCGTIIDLFFVEKLSKYGKARDVLLSFSVTRNWQILSSIAHSRGSIECIHGIRVFTLMWMLIAHQYESSGIGVPMINTLDYYLLGRETWTALIHSGTVGIDTFFFLGGFLTCYLCFMELKKGNKFNVFVYYINRYLRLTTGFAFLVGYTACLSSYVGYGPHWRPFAQSQAQLCKDKWWVSLLYIYNFMIDPMRGQCVGQGWYLNIDMQLYWVAPILILPLMKWPKWTLIVVVPVLVLASCFAPFTWTYLNEGPMNYANLYLTPGVSQKYSNEVYFQSYMRATPYIVGIAFAYLMTKDLSKFKMPMWAVVCGWLLSTGVALVVIFIPSIPLTSKLSEYEYDLVGSSFYAGFHKLGWSLVIAWIIFACVHGYGGPVNRVLSWRMFLPLSRLSFGMYLWHFTVMGFYGYYRRTLSYFSHFNVISTFIPMFILTALISGVIFVAVEAPTLGLLKLFLRDRSHGKKKSTEE